MKLRTQYEFLFVGRDEGSFLENYAYNVSEGDQGSTKVFLCLEIQNNPAEAEMIGERIFEVLKKSFFAQREERDPYVRFEAALKDINRVIDGFREGKVSGHIGRIHAIVAVLCNDNLYLSQTGDSEAYLIRKRFVSSVSEGLYDPKSKEVFTSIANGELEPGDFILFCSTRLLRYVSRTNVARAISGDLSRSLSEIRDLVMGEILGKIAFIGVTVSQQGDSDDDRGEDRVEDDSSENEPMYSPGDFPRPSRRKDGIGSALQFFANLVSPEKLKAAGKFLGSLRLPVWMTSETGPVAKLTARVRDRFWSDGVTRDKMITFGLVIALVGGLGIWFFRGSQIRSAEIAALDAKLTQVRQEISEAEVRGQTDKAAAGVILAHAEESARSALSSNTHRAKASEMLALIGTTRDRLDNIRHLKTVRAYADLSSQDSSLNLLGFVASGNRFFAYDSSRIFEVILDTVQKPVVVDAADPIIGATNFDERQSVLLFTKSGKLYEFKDGSVRQMQTLDGAFHKGVAIEDWGSRVYILDSAADQIWRYSYVKSKDVFGVAEGYKLDGTVKDGVDIAIDGSVYVLNRQTPNLSRFYGGTSQQFTIKNPSFLSPTHPTRFYTDGDVSFAFVLDNAESKAYVYAKDTQKNEFTYRYQVALDDLKDLRDVSYNQSTNQLYVMDAKKIYEVNL